MICKESDLRYILNRLYHKEEYPEDAMDLILGRFNKPTDLDRLPVRISLTSNGYSRIRFGRFDFYQSHAHDLKGLLKYFRRDR